MDENSLAKVNNVRTPLENFVMELDRLRKALQCFRNTMKGRNE